MLNAHFKYFIIYLFHNKNLYCKCQKAKKILEKLDKNFKKRYKEGSWVKFSPKRAKFFILRIKKIKFPSSSLFTSNITKINKTYFSIFMNFSQRLKAQNINFLLFLIKNSVNSR